MRNSGPNTETSLVVSIQLLHTIIHIFKKKSCSFEVLCYTKGHNRGPINRSEVFRNLI